jgi:hypothetical protein
MKAHDLALPYLMALLMFKNKNEASVIKTT